MNIIDDEILEKTNSIFHLSYITLQQQYQLRNFKKYSELISSLPVVEKNNELLIKNQLSPPTIQRHFQKQMLYFSKNYGREYNHGRGCGRGRGHRPRLKWLLQLFTKQHNPKETLCGKT